MAYFRNPDIKQMDSTKFRTVISEGSFFVWNPV